MESAGSFGSSSVPSTGTTLVRRARADVLLKQREHPRLQVVGIHLPGRPHGVRELQREVAGSRADIGDGGATGDTKQPHGTVGVLLLHPLRAIEPGAPCTPMGRA